MMWFVIMQILSTALDSFGYGAKLIKKKTSKSRC